MNQKKVVLLFALFLASLAAVTLPLDTSQTNKHGDMFSSAICNANTVVDFVFSSGSSLNFGSNVVSIIKLRVVPHPPSGIWISLGISLSTQWQMDN
jgi:hypothetical protein